MKISRNYSILLKSYQLKDFLLSKSISFTTDECKLILESGFCQSLSRDIRKKIKEEINCNVKNTVDITLLAITHRIFISDFDRFQRKIKLSESFDTVDLIRSINIVQHIIEYLCSLLLLCENNCLEENCYVYQDDLKNELISLTLLCDTEEVFFTETLLDEQFSNELKCIKIPGSKTLRDSNKLLFWSQNLVELISEYIISVSVPCDLIKFSSLMEQFIKEQRNEILMEMKNQLFPVVKSLRSILLQVITSFEGKNEENGFLLFLFRIFEFSANMAGMAMEEICNFLDDNEFIYLVTAIQLLSISRIYGTLKLDERKIVFLLSETGLIYENMADFYFNGSSLEKSFNIIEKILNDIYLKYEDHNSLIGNIIEDYEILSKEIQRPLCGIDVFNLIKTLLHCNNRRFFYGKF